MRPSQDWNVLIQKHLDGQTTEEEAQALSTGIEDDAEVRSQYLKAAQIHGALADETLALDVESEREVKAAAPKQQKEVGQFAWPRQIAAGLVAGIFVGLLGVGMIWAIDSPKVEAQVFDIAHGDFETWPKDRLRHSFRSASVNGPVIPPRWSRRRMETRFYDLSVPRM